LAVTLTFDPALKKLPEARLTEPDEAGKTDEDNWYWVWKLAV
jgi:hypothetical protein